MLRATREEAMRGLVDFGRIETMLDRVGDRIDLVRLDRVTPLSAPLMLEHGRVPIDGAGRERLLADRAGRLLEEAGLADLQLAGLQIADLRIPDVQAKNGA